MRKLNKHYSNKTYFVDEEFRQQAKAILQAAVKAKNIFVDEYIRQQSEINLHRTATATEK